MPASRVKSSNRTDRRDAVVIIIMIFAPSWKSENVTCRVRATAGLMRTENEFHFFPLVFYPLNINRKTALPKCVVVVHHRTTTVKLQNSIYCRCNSRFSAPDIYFYRVQYKRRTLILPVKSSRVQLPNIYLFTPPGA